MNLHDACLAMFYAESFEDRLRFGDVLCDLPSAHVSLSGPPAPIGAGPELTLEVSTPLSVLLTPCCEVGNTNSLTLAPVSRLNKYVKLLRNDYFREDLLRLNEKAPPEKCIPSGEWDALVPSEQERRLAKGSVYALNYLFAYPVREPVLTPYDAVTDVGNGRETLTIGYYLIDFREAYRLSIVKERHKEFTSCKKLQLTPETREQLRRKLSQFFAEPPDEDVAAMAAARGAPVAP